MDLLQQGGFAIALALVLSALAALWRAHLKLQDARARDAQAMTQTRSEDTRLITEASVRMAMSLDANTRIVEAVLDAIQTQGLAVRPRRLTGQPI